MATSVVLSCSFVGLSRALFDGLQIHDDEAQWRHVASHEQRFVRALRSGTASEGDEDAGV